MTREQKSIVEYSREYLASICTAPYEDSESVTTPPSFAWFGCENDAELLAEIEQSAKANSALNGGNAFCTVNESDLVRVLDIMYHS